MAGHDARLEKLNARRAALDLKINRLVAVEKERRRREDTRMKIIIGGALIALAKRDAVSVKALADQMRPLIEERDRPALTALFQADGWALLEGLAARQEARRARDNGTLQPQISTKSAETSFPVVTGTSVV
ncbi:hypothetical protein F2P47_06670 [Parvibaculum sedimenti]|uniref:Mobilization protein n=1 Tax=Parvibaculum sedimenti TaxID=2608632 RepID=A0A6N6VPB0_9HYPH|nr:hypothetical protein [Parvibaculum sedimenti]KAB7740724.1 hypothetical protein F2P47_06670 [Parvibaculum sedimenti]